MKKIAVFIFAVSLILSSCGRKKVANQFEEVPTPTVAAKKEEKSYFDVFNQGWGWAYKHPYACVIGATVVVVIVGFGAYKLYKYYHRSNTNALNPLANANNPAANQQPEDENNKHED